MNLLEETKQALKLNGKTPDDIIFIGNEYFICTWEDFVILADEEYDSGYGSAQVATDLVITFRDRSWLSRGEYDGAEWWRFNKCPNKPRNAKKIKLLIGRYGPELQELHDPTDHHHRS